MEIPRDSNGNIDFESFLYNLDTVLVRTQNPYEVVKVTASNEEEAARIENYLDPNTYNVKCERAENGYQVNISAII